MTAGWKTVLDDQLDLYRFWRSNHGEQAAAAFAESMRNVAREVGGRKQVEMEEHMTGNLLRIETLKTFSCEPIYVADEMMDLIEFASESFKAEPLQPSDLVTLMGFLVLPRPMFMLDRHGLSTAFRAISWYPAAYKRGPEETTGVFIEDLNVVAPGGVHLSLYSHIDDEDDYYIKEGPEFVAMVKEMHRSYGTPYALTHVTPWMFDQQVPGVGDAEHEVVSGGWWRPVQALLRVMMQTVSERTREKPPRASGRRWTREKPDFEPYVTVVRLRRPKQKGQDGQEHEVEWQKRWIVSGHWRNQFFPSLNAHQQIWIHPYVKGPEDKPLVVRKGHAFEFVK